MDQIEIDKIVSDYSTPSGRILGILEGVQKIEGYLSKEALQYLSEKLKVPLGELYSIVTFYSFFNLKALGAHTITVCMGTACHVKGAPIILDTLKMLLKTKEGEVSEEGKFQLTTKGKDLTLNTARCFGACSMAPVIRIDGKIYGYMIPEMIPIILKQYGWREK